MKEMKRLTWSEITDKMTSCMNGDGHGEYYASWYQEAGWPDWFIKPRTVRSNRRDHKSTLYKDGKVVEQLDNVVNSLSFHMKVCSHLNIPYESYYGRGSQAAACARAFFNARKKQAGG